MEYMFLLYVDPKESAEQREARFEERMARHSAIMNEAREKGIFRGASPLRHVSTGFLVRPEGGQLTVSDGPFVETKEVVGGYYILDCADADEAKYWASRIAETSCATTVEGRPLATMPEILQRAARGEPAHVAVHA